MRTDVFGGTLPGWQALLTVHGASLLPKRPLLAVDLTGRHVNRPLTAMTRRTGIGAATYRLPHDLGRCGLLAELSHAQLADDRGVRLGLWATSIEQPVQKGKARMV
jgi:hypothetical protein